MNKEIVNLITKLNIASLQSEDTIAVLIRQGHSSLKLLDSIINKVSIDDEIEYSAVYNFKLLFDWDNKNQFIHSEVFNDDIVGSVQHSIELEKCIRMINKIIIRPFPILLNYQELQFIKGFHMTLKVYIQIYEKENE